jgi:alpha-tubulin suppressor-like RCC1 family protein
VSSDGVAWGWGENPNGLLGTGGRDWRVSSPTAARGTPRLVEISSEFAHTCARSDSGGVWCWGENGYGELGIGSDRSIRYAPAEVPGLSEVVQISVGERHSCARTRAGIMLCWGDGSYGELGTGDRENRDRPTTVPLPCEAAYIEAGGFASCSVCGDGRVLCWGDGGASWTASNPPPLVLIPTVVEGLADVVSVSIAYRHGCALRRDRSVWCWGSNKDGALGVGRFAERLGPTLVPGLSDVRQVVTRTTPPNSGYSCLLRGKDEVLCAGATIWGQLGAAGMESSAAFIPAVW